MKQKSILIDREYASGGREVARILSEKTGMDFYDGNLLYFAGERYGIDLGQMRRYDEQGVGSILHDFAMAVETLGGADREAPFRSYEAMGRLMKLLVREKPCIILGRCAAELLQGETPFAHVFIYAGNMDDRIRRVQSLGECEGGNVEAYIRRKDQQRRNYHRFFTEKKWGEPQNYDLLLNTSALGYEKAADAILAIL
ncbi:MAG: cytidylate kinase-like family protein [Clostridia bacterium]|nr:cytidylate kinase-like family protein [Clostridia bacterium]